MDPYGSGCHCLMMRIYTNFSPLLSLIERGEIHAGSEIVPVLQSAGIDGLELNARILDLKQYLLPEFSFCIDQLNGLPLSLHSDYVDFNPASVNPYTRKAALDQLRDEIELCERYSIPILTIHPGWAKKIGRRLALDHFWRFLSEIFDSHHCPGTMLCLENMDHRREKLCNNAEEIALTLERFPQLMLTVDFAHLGLTGTDIPTFLDRFEKSIAHLHLSGVIAGKRHGEISLPASELDFKSHLERYRDTEIAAVIENQSWELMLSSKKILDNFRR